MDADWRAVVLLSVCFALVEGSLLVILALETAVNEEVGEITTGALYVCFACGSLAAPSVVRRLGSLKRSICAGLSLVVVYIMTNAVPTLATLLPGAMLAGLGASLMWVAALRYIARRAELHSDGRHLGAFNGWFSSTLFLLTVSSEVGSSLFLSGGHFAEESDPPKARVVFLFVIFSATAVAAVASLWAFLPQVVLAHAASDTDGGKTHATTGWSGLVRVGLSPDLLRMLASNMAFGLSQAFQNSDFARNIVKPSIGISNIGNLSSISSVTGFLSAYPIGLVSDRWGRAPVMVLGFCAHAGYCVLLLVTEGTDRGWAVLGLTSSMMGLGNAVWNTCNASLFGELFAEQLENGFALLKFTSGGATALAYFLYPVLGVRTELSVLLGVQTAGLFGFWLVWRGRHERGARLLSTGPEDLELDDDGDDDGDGDRFGKGDEQQEERLFD